MHFILDLNKTVTDASITTTLPIGNTVSALQTISAEKNKTAEKGIFVTFVFVLDYKLKNIYINTSNIRVSISHIENISKYV